MARLFLILLIALLPLRGWSAERMAVSMAAGEVASQAMAMGAEPGAMPEDCPMMLAKQGGDGTAERGCQTCQLCMGLAATQAPAVKAVSHQPNTAAFPCADRFSSASVERAIKPPIA